MTAVTTMATVATMTPVTTMAVMHGNKPILLIALQNIGKNDISVLFFMKIIGGIDRKSFGLSFFTS